MKIKEMLVHRICRLFEVKSIVTILLTVAMVAMLFRVDAVAPELLSLFSTAYGAVITYFFTRKSEDEGGKQNGA